MLREYKVHWKAVFINHMSDKILASKIYKERTLIIVVLLMVPH